MSIVNREFKNSVFSSLFGKPDTLRELYGALTGVELPPDVKIEINTLQDVLFLDRINDLSFAIEEKLVLLIEHQSTINPNMAVRLLMYIARVYEKILGERNIYSGKKIILPRPEFIVLYNGTAPYPDTDTIRLSDSFAEAVSLGLPKDLLPPLELEAKVYNINEGHNTDLIRRSGTLGEYSVFVAKVREYEAEITGESKRALTKDELTAAMTQAVQWCIGHNVLKGFLETNSSEVTNMLITEWNWDKFIEVREQEAVEQGRVEGWQQGRQQSQQEVARRALAEGLPVEMVRKITGIDMQTIHALST
jgi:hypothetical protein